MTGVALLTLVAVLSGPSVTAMTRRGPAAGFQQGAAPVQAPKSAQGPASRPPEGRGFGPVPGPAPSGSRPDFFPWWKDADIIKQIGLTGAQAASIDKLYERRLRQIQLQADEYAKQSAELDRMMSERAVKPEEIELQASKMLTPKVEIDKSRIKMLYEMSRVMSADQNKKLQDVVQRRREQQRREQGDRGRGRNPSGK